jgi:DNA-binding transcriptional ArsR family regulator
MRAQMHRDALGDANRRAIVEILSAGGRSVQEIADRLPISRPAVSRHLRFARGRRRTRFRCMDLSLRDVVAAVPHRKR